MPATILCQFIHLLAVNSPWVQLRDLYRLLVIIEQNASELSQTQAVQLFKDLGSLCRDLGLASTFSQISVPFDEDVLSRNDLLPVNAETQLCNVFQEQFSTPPQTYTVYGNNETTPKSYQCWDLIRFTRTQWYNAMYHLTNTILLSRFRYWDSLNCVHNQALSNSNALIALLENFRRIEILTVPLFINIFQRLLNHLPDIEAYVFEFKKESSSNMLANSQVSQYV